MFCIIKQMLWLDEEHISSDTTSNLEAGLSKQLPQHTSPHSSFATEVMEDGVMMAMKNGEYIL